MYKEINLNCPQEEYPIFSSYTYFPTDIHLDKSINKSIIEKTMVETPKSCLKIEDRGEKQFNNSIVENYFGSFRVYEISMIDEKSSLKIKCFRRYSNFVILDKFLRSKYPFYIIPELPPKNPLLKIKNYTDQEFYLSREKSLNFYMNFLFLNPNLNNTSYFKKFLNDPEFDDDFFEIDKSITDFPVFEKYKKSIKIKMKNMFFGIFQKENFLIKNEASEEEKVFNNNLEFFNNLIIIIEDMMKTIVLFKLKRLNL